MHRVNRKQVLFNIFGALLSNILDCLSRYYIKNGYPQIAILSHDHIGNRINIFGRYEKEQLSYLQPLINSRNLGSGVCLDIGANIGNHALFFSSLFHKVHAFEPSQTSFALLKFNTHKKNNIQCHQIGLSDSCTTMQMITPANNIGMGSLELAASKSDSIIVEHVNVVTLDSIECLNNAKVELIKLDVEGHELAVLTGAYETIRRNKPIILFEQQANEIVLGSSKVIEKLRSYGYKNFYCYTSRSRRFPRFIGTIVRIIIGDTITLTKQSEFEHKHYSMILAFDD